MSFQNQSGELAGFTEVVPASASFGVPERSSILTGRRRARVTPQTGSTSSPSQQIQFLIADQGGMIDMKSVVINYTVLTSGTAAPVMDDAHPFMNLQVLLNGQLLENQQNACKTANVEMALGGSRGYYKTAGSFQGFELLNDDLDTLSSGLAPAVVTPGSVGSYGFVAGNLGSIYDRQSRVAAAIFNNIAGEQRSIPLGLCCGLGRMNTYVPISLIGELALVLTTGSENDVLVNTLASGTSTYTLSNLSIEYDIVVPDARYFNLLKKIATEDGNGLVMPFESTVVSTAGSIAASATLTESAIIVSRATNNLLRANVVFIPTAGNSVNYPSQSCFSHAGVYSVQFRIGSQVYPQIACQGDASLFNMSMAAYGSVQQENGTCINRCLWGNSTDPASRGTTTLQVLETADLSTGGSAKFCYGDRFIPSYGFGTLKGGLEPNIVDGVNLSGSSGSQLIVSIISAPTVGYTPYVITTATKFIVAKQGSVMVQGA
jgi:hypothetical protein